jgi:hypothetical protein
MDTTKMRHALRMLGECVDAKTADDALADLDVLEALRSSGVASLRDTFAASALQGILANPTTVAGGATWDIVGAEVAKVAYIVADAMLAAREGK